MKFILEIIINGKVFGSCLILDQLVIASHEHLPRNNVDCAANSGYNLKFVHQRFRFQFLRFKVFLFKSVPKRMVFFPQ